MHCHITGMYHRAAYNQCDFKLRLKPKTVPIPVVFHNLKGFDGHLLMQAKSRVQGEIKCIPNNAEKDILFSLGDLRFNESWATWIPLKRQTPSLSKPHGNRSKRKAALEERYLSVQYNWICFWKVQWGKAPRKRGVLFKAEWQEHYGRTVLSGSLSKSGPLHFGSEKSFPSNFS